MNRTVAIVGLGIMGGAIARNLVERGWRVIGFDIDAATRAELARDAPIIMTSLSSPEAVIEVPHAIAGAGLPPRIAVELSTLTIADKLRFETILKQAGHIALDCPLSGTGAQARVRDLVVYASGDSDAIARCTELFADFAEQSADGDHRRVRRRCRLRDPDVHADAAGLCQGDGDGIGRSGLGSRIRGLEEDHHRRAADPRAGITASAPEREGRQAALHQSQAARRGTWSGFTTCFHGCASATASSPVRCRVASSRCLRSEGR